MEFALIERGNPEWLNLYAHLADATVKAGPRVKPGVTTRFNECPLGSGLID